MKQTTEMNKPCTYCIKISYDPRDPQPCKECMKYCQCYDDLKCQFCIQITGHLITTIKKTSEWYSGYLKNYPCYCLDKNKPEYILKCEDCKMDHCYCNSNYKKNNKIPKCPFCFEKEYNKIILLAKPDDFTIIE
jgi:hypothetical protein